MKSKKSDIEETKRIMGALVRMPPKPHEDMKVGKGTRPKARSPRKKRSTNKRD